MAIIKTSSDFRHDLSLSSESESRERGNGDADENSPRSKNLDGAEISRVFRFAGEDLEYVLRFFVPIINLYLLTAKRETSNTSHIEYY